jgi:hypothetical protein
MLHFIEFFQSIFIEIPAQIICCVEIDFFREKNPMLPTAACVRASCHKVRPHSLHVLFDFERLF